MKALLSMAELVDQLGGDRGHDADQLPHGDQLGGDQLGGDQLDGGLFSACYPFRRNIYLDGRRGYVYAYAHGYALRERVRVQISARVPIPNLP